MSEAVRLSKRMTELGLCSRREADEYIEMGLVKVDGVVVDTLGSRVLPDQKIEVERRPLGSQPDRVSLLYFKPAGVELAVGYEACKAPFTAITAEQRSSSDHSQIKFLRKHQQFLQTPFDLDADTSGLVMLSQDDRLVRRLNSTLREYEQEFLLELSAAQMSERTLATLKDWLKHQPSLQAKLTRQGETQLRLVLRGHANGAIRAMENDTGIEFSSLRRIRIGRCALGKLDQGEWRYLDAGERV